MKNKFIEKLKLAKAKKMGKVITKDDDLSLSELREKYPKISARSKVEFLQKIKS
jgi:hypothetical protein